MSCQFKSRGRPQRRFLRHHGIYRSDVSLPLFTPGPVPLSGRAGCQGIGHAGKNMSCPSSAMSSGRLFLDRVARLQSPSPLHRQCQDKALAASGQSVYHRTVDSVLTGCLTRGGHPKSMPLTSPTFWSRRSKAGPFGRFSAAPRMYQFFRFLEVPCKIRNWIAPMLKG